MVVPAILRQTLQPQAKDRPKRMLLARQRRRARLILQQTICFDAWFGLVFYPISCLLLRDKLAALEYNSALQRALPVCCLVVLIPADVARYYLGTRGNLRAQVFPLTAFMFLSACPVFPGLVYLSFFAEHRLPFDIVAGAGFVFLLIAECVAGFVVLRELLRQEAARFLKMREFSDVATSEGDEERVRFLPGGDREPVASLALRPLASGVFSRIIRSTEGATMSALRSMETTHKSTTVLRCKVAIVGDATVGKTALLQVLKSNGHEYPKNYVMTSDVELSTKSIAIPDTNVVVELYLFDCAGQSIFNQLDFGTVHYKGASMALVVFDVNNKESFKSCSKWYQDVRDASPNHNIPGVLLANKTDLRYNNRDAITTKETEEFAERNDLKYFECSAQQNSGVEAPFAYIADWFHKKYQAATQRA